MTQEQTKQWFEGKDLWNKYVNLNDYSFSYTEKGVKNLSKETGLKPSYIKERLTFYLEN